MILVDTSVWVDHLRSGDEDLVGLLDNGQVLGHTWVTGELALGRLSARAELFGLLAALPQAEVAKAEEVMAFIERHQLYGLGIGLVDAHLLAATALTAEATLWTRDRWLADAAARLGCAFSP